MLLSVQEVLSIGLDIAKIYTIPEQQRMSESYLNETFHGHYGNTPLDVASVWYDLTVTDISDAALTGKEKTYKGFCHYLKAVFFCWAYPKNARMLASRFGTNLTYAQG